VALLGATQIEIVVDIRRIPRSRTNPQYNQELLGPSLAPFGIRYEYIAELGGRRARAKNTPDNVNGFWKNRSFHNYADYALTEDFAIGLEKLIKLGRRKRCAMMCSEAVWWRCHRRIVADHLLARGERVFHLMGHDRIEVAHFTEGACLRRTKKLEYPEGRKRGCVKP
jgi:uncharacterized protein (DUF488 family)